MNNLNGTQSFFLQSRIFLIHASFALLLTFMCQAAPARGQDRFDQDHTAFSLALGKFVENGRVDYASLAENREGLDGYLSSLEDVPESRFSAWGEPDRIAFLINLYNAVTLRLILDHYPVKSIKDIGGWFSTPWEAPAARLWGRQVTLDMIEHGILRKQYSEPRIHAALVCAAMGCPPLRSEAYAGRLLEEQLNSQTRRFLAIPTQNRVDRAAGVVYLSPVFKWYRGDFEKNGGGVLGFLRPYWPEQAARDFDNGREWRIKYTYYNWALNGMERKDIERRGKEQKR